MKAAKNSLINPNQGWEPIRYDTFNNIIIYQHAKLRSFVTDSAGSRYLAVESFEIDNISRCSVVDYTSRELDSRFIFDVTQRDFKKDNYSKLNTRPLLFCWPDKDTVINEYFPETVTNLGELLKKSQLYGTYKTFWQEIQFLWNRLRDKSRIVDVITVHCVRRPLPS